LFETFHLKVQSILLDLNELGGNFARDFEQQAREKLPRLS
jgi:hypothetical protein